MNVDICGGIDAALKHAHQIRLRDQRIVAIPPKGLTKDRDPVDLLGGSDVFHDSIHAATADAFAPHHFIPNDRSSQKQLKSKLDARDRWYHFNDDRAFLSVCTVIFTSDLA